MKCKLASLHVYSHLNALLFTLKSEIKNNIHCSHERIILMNVCFGVIYCFAGPAFVLRLAIYSDCKKEKAT